LGFHGFALRLGGFCALALNSDCMVTAQMFKSDQWCRSSGGVVARTSLLVLVSLAFALNVFADGDPALSHPPAASYAPAAESQKTNRWQFHWQEGLYYQFRSRIEFGGTNRVFKESVSEEVKFSGKIGGLLQTDAAGYFRQSGNVDYQDGVELRRLRLYAKGDWKLFLPVNYKIQIGYDNPDFVLYDLYVWWADVRWVNTFKLGYFKVPMTLSGYGSSADTLMMETATSVEAFYPSERTGLQMGGPEFQNRATWALALLSIGQKQDVGNASSSDLQVVTRVTGLPWFSDEEGQGRRLLHLGLNGNYSFSSGSTVRFRSRPESHLAPYVVDTGDINARDSFIFGGEAALVQGPFSVQAELMTSYVVSNNDERTANFRGGYLTGSWFLTGESRPYNPAAGLFLPIRPNHNFSIKTGGLGALELVAQASYLNLTSEGIDGGEIGVLGAGLNWYWSPVVRWQFNSLFSRVRGGLTPGDAFILQTRLQLSL
jgi:phosphate-selective porin OprO/OprP